MYTSNKHRNVTFILAGICIAVFFITYLVPGISRLLAISPYGLLRLGMFWTPLTYMFVHGGISHLLFNMVFLIFIAPSVEERMGSREFTVYYLLTGVLAGLFSVFAYMASGANTFIVGASGALYGVLLAFAAYFPQARLMVFYVIPMRAPYAMALFAGLDLFMQLRGGTGVAHLTHLSGLFFGYLYFLIRLRIDPVKEMRR
ncbi:MAG: hypothetical protein B0D92_01675 [Spirochaeta sp. LUC14_002_19_P3]|nr:MAG: hypothetical protein B0D92_01675 [Spirochaeta sp. LUC14_002_19_P3]